MRCISGLSIWTGSTAADKGKSGAGNHADPEGHGLGDSDFVTGSLEVVKPFLSREDLGLSPTFQTPNPG